MIASKIVGRMVGKTYFAFIHQSEATQEAMRWSWTERKVEAPIVASKIVGRMVGKPYFAFIHQSEATREAMRWSWTRIE